MSARYFLDTNVFVYSLDQASPLKAQKAAKLIREALDVGSGMISYQVVQEFFHVALRRFSRPMSPHSAQEYFNTTFRPLLAVQSSPALFITALQIFADAHLSWFDCLIVAAAREANCATLYSEDMQHGRVFGGLRIENPFR
jgi:predicted nucleic acid-binding protein